MNEIVCVCGKAFQKKYANQKYCSKRCSKKHRKEYIREFMRKRRAKEKKDKKMLAILRKPLSILKMLTRKIFKGGAK